jgi:manganese oxidase
MRWNVTRLTFLVVVLTIVHSAIPLAAQSLTPISANDNRIPAGELRGGVLTLRLDMRKGNWHPESETGETIPVYAFGETGKSLQIPGPTIRVPQGTTIDISLHNELTVPATLHGLHQRPGDDANVITVAAGATEHIRFVAGAPGTYLYWGRTPDGRRGNNRVADSLLGGALVIDPPGVVPKDRIFVLGRWNGPTRTSINGKSWPYTERLDYAVGESVHWKVINASDLSHPMHLHGFHFELDAVGNGENYKVFEPGLQPLEFTHNVEIAETYEMTWVPKEPGRWLYHCHRIPHMRLPVPLDAADVTVADNHEHVHDEGSDYAGMGGMIVGITISGKSSIDTTTNWKPQRRLELAVGERNGDTRFYQLSLRDLDPAAAKARPTMSTGLTGPVIVLNQNQPTEISVVNKLKEATSIHWHGMEIESYYDGVPEWGGIGDRKTPPVAPGQTFTARMTPPRAGTFMYHTHWHDDAQLTGGVHGILVVLPAGQTFDPTTDKTFLLSQGPNEPFGNAMILMNGVPQPNTMQLRTGVTYRFRFANITPSVNNLQVSLRSTGSPVDWRIVAKDAASVHSVKMQPADQLIAVGETFDFEYRAGAPGQLTLEALSPNDNRRAVQTLIFTNPQQ